MSRRPSESRQNELHIKRSLDGACAAASAPHRRCAEKFFAKESVAKAYVERLAKRLGDYHRQALGLSDWQKLEVSECYRARHIRDGAATCELRLSRYPQSQQQSFNLIAATIFQSKENPGYRKAAATSTTT